MEFDKDGRIILPSSIVEDKMQDSNSIILEKVQVNIKNPAIAQLKIRIGANLKRDEEFLIREIHNYCKNFIDHNQRYNDVDSNIRLTGTSVIIEAKSSFQMYSLLNNIIEEMHMLYVKNKGIPISIRGSFGF